MISMRAKAALVLVVLTLAIGLQAGPARSSDVIGNWKAEISFGSGPVRSLRFELRSSGKGVFLPPLGPEPNQILPTDPGSAQWSQSDGQSFRISGPVQFPLGNIAIERGTLILEGKLKGGNTITGKASFFPADQNPATAGAKPSKAGTFKATRITG
jgi:hypothetical protein